MRTNRVLALGASMLVALAACSSGGGGKADIKIGSDNFYESKLMAEIYSQVLENAGYKVTRSFGLGSRQDRAPAFEKGQVDLGAETQDLEVKVIPSISDSIAVGTAIVNPLAGLAALIVGRALSNPIDNLAAFEYRVTGKWEDPVVRKVLRATAAPASSGQR